MELVTDLLKGEHYLNVPLPTEGEESNLNTDKKIPTPSSPSTKKASESPKISQKPEKSKLSKTISSLSQFPKLKKKSTQELIRASNEDLTASSAELEYLNKMMKNEEHPMSTQLRQLFSLTRTSPQLFDRIATEFHKDFKTKSEISREKYFQSQISVLISKLVFLLNESDSGKKGKIIETLLREPLKIAIEDFFKKEIAIAFKNLGDIYKRYQLIYQYEISKYIENTVITKITKMMVLHEDGSLNLGLMNELIENFTSDPKLKNRPFAISLRRAQNQLIQNPSLEKFLVQVPIPEKGSLGEICVRVSQLLPLDAKITKACTVRTLLASFCSPPVNPEDYYSQTAAFIASYTLENDPERAIKDMRQLLKENCIVRSYRGSKRNFHPLLQSRFSSLSKRLSLTKEGQIIISQNQKVSLCDDIGLYSISRILCQENHKEFVSNLVKKLTAEPENDQELWNYSIKEILSAIATDTPFQQSLNSSLNGTQKPLTEEFLSLIYASQVDQAVMIAWTNAIAKMGLVSQLNVFHETFVRSTINSLSHDSEHLLDDSLKIDSLEIFLNKHFKKRLQVAYGHPSSDCPDKKCEEGYYLIDVDIAGQRRPKFIRWNGTHLKPFINEIIDELPENFETVKKIWKENNLSHFWFLELTEYCKNLDGQKSLEVKRCSSSPAMSSLALTLEDPKETLSVFLSPQKLTKTKPIFPIKSEELLNYFVMEDKLRNLKFLALNRSFVEILDNSKLYKIREKLQNKEINSPSDYFSAIKHKIKLTPPSSELVEEVMNFLLDQLCEENRLFFQKSAHCLPVKSIPEWKKSLVDLFTSQQEKNKDEMTKIRHKIKKIIIKHCDSELWSEILSNTVPFAKASWLDEGKASFLSFSVNPARAQLSLALYHPEEKRLKFLKDEKWLCGRPWELFNLET